MRSLTQVTPPSEPILSIGDAKEHLRVTHSMEDSLIASLVEAATAWLDGWNGVLGVALEAQTWEMTLDAFPAGEMCIPLGPVVSIEAIEYTDANGDGQTIPPADYQAQGGRVRHKNGWPSINDEMGGVRVRFIAGSGTPDGIKHVTRLLIGHWYANREAAGDKIQAIPMAVNMLIAPVKRWSV